MCLVLCQMHYIVLVGSPINFYIAFFRSSFVFCSLSWCQVCSFHSLVVRSASPVACLDLSSCPSPLFCVASLFSVSAMSLSRSFSFGRLGGLGGPSLFLPCAQAFHRRSARASACVFSLPSLSLSLLIYIYMGTTSAITYLFPTQNALPPVSGPKKKGHFSGHDFVHRNLAFFGCFSSPKTALPPVLASISHKTCSKTLFL